MATKVGSIFVEVGGDTTKLKNSLQSAETGLKGFAGKLNDTVKNLTGFSLGSLTAAGAMMKVGQFVMDATNETQKYNLAMSDMALKMGTSTEEASRLVQVADDVRVSQEQLSTAMNFAIRNGIQPSIEGMAQLADKYTALEDPVARGKLLLETFGRSGMEMGKLLEKGGDGIRAMSEGIDESLVVTEEAVAASKKYYAAVDELNDAWTGVKMTIGNEVIPVLTDLINGQNDLDAATAENIETISKGAGLWQNYGMTQEEVGAKVQQMTLDMYWARVEEEALATATTDANSAALEQFDGLTKLSSAMIYNKAAANLDSEAALQLGIDLGVIDQEAITASKTLDLLAKAQKSGYLTAGQYADAVERLNQQIGSIHDAEATILLNIITNGSLPSNIGKGDWMRPGSSGSSATGFATGASFTVPAGFHDDTYPIYAKTGEQVDIKPAGQPQAGINELLSAIRSMPGQISRAVRDAVLTA